MSRLKAETSLPRIAFDAGARIAIDLGAQSCRVSLLRWVGTTPRIELVHRFANGAVQSEGALRWDLSRILEGVDEGLRLCAKIATEGVASIAVDGWAVDYVRLNSDGKAVAEPYCYRDARNQKAYDALHQRLAPERLREMTGIQLQPLNTVYQQHADALDGQNGRWLNLPEYLLYRMGGRGVSERSNAAHTGLMALDGTWSREIFEAAGIRIEDAPEIVDAGTDLGAYTGPIEALHGARLIAPCCHDTASAVAGIPARDEHWAYISSGTWSLVGTTVAQACNSEAASEENFTNLGAAGGRFLFHKGMSGMWLLQQCLAAWERDDVAEIVAAAREVDAYCAKELIDVDDPVLAVPCDMPAVINTQRAARGLAAIQDHPQMARLIFDSLAHRYAEVLGLISAMTGKSFSTVYIVGGGSQNELLNELTAQATGMKVLRGHVESSTIGNFALQCACAEGDTSAASVMHWALRLN